MADDVLRELELTWRRERSVQSEVAYLQAWVRAGRLTLERLELAAFLGHPAARALAQGRALRGEALDHELLELLDPGPWRDLLAWVQGLQRWSLELVPRGAIEVFAAALESRPRGDMEADWARELVATARVALDDPVPANIVGLRSRPDDLSPERRRFAAERRIGMFLFGAGHVCHAVDTLFTNRRSMATEGAGSLEAAVVRVASHAVVSLERGGVSAANILQSATGALVAWALDATS